MITFDLHNLWMTLFTLEADIYAKIYRIKFLWMRIFVEIWNDGFEENVSHICARKSQKDKLTLVQRQKYPFINGNLYKVRDKFIILQFYQFKIIKISIKSIIIHKLLQNFLFRYHYLWLNSKNLIYSLKSS